MTHVLRGFLLELGARLRSDEMARRVQGSWDNAATRPRVTIDPPATAAQLAALEAELGEPLPPGLREVLGEVSAGIEMIWVLRGHHVPTSYGQRVETTVTPPDRFMSWSHTPNADGTYPEGARYRPDIISGGFRFSLDGVRQAHQGRAGWLEAYADDPTMDAETRSHYAVIRGVMAAGFPVMTAPNGDWLAIDQRTDDGAMLHVNHEGEEAGIEIDLDFPRYLAHLAWLGPVWPDFSEMFTFSARNEEVVPGDYRVQSAEFGGASEAGAAWRAWFWGEDQPELPENLQGRL
ncbi:hypothetical protein FHY55_04435 [Oceanicola sp. D3]|uniref:hypothetical protein n=1 Tax=Oceanicola sp. D3 TaxID=2587163 RepID=UPI00111D45A2|nr:hypothetical protein [Oceanicola sp. D3]QDC08533.1 hypothetical protein FHY55_04435 [Oceanicola sp. D3]